MQKVISAICTRSLEAPTSDVLNILYKDINQLNKKIEKIKNTPFTIFTDFDTTLTRSQVNGKKANNSFDVFYVVSLS